MRTLRTVFVLSLMAAGTRAASAQSVPDVTTISAKFQRVVVVRVKHGVDLLEGLRQAVEREKIRNAVILSGIGSLTSYHIHVVENRVFPPKDVFIKKDEAVDFTAAQGYIIDGRVHCHITLSTDKAAIAGHLEPGSKVFTFLAITLGVLEDGVSLQRIDDWQWR